MRRVLLLIGGVLLSSCAAQPSPQQISRGPALWVVESGSAKVYLFGTMHLLLVDVPWFTPTLRSAFANSQDLWVETDLNDIPGVQKALRPGFDPTYDLSAHLSQSEWATLREFSGKCGVPDRVIAHLRPWAVNFALYECNAQGLAKALDKHQGQPPKRPAHFNQPDLFLVNLAGMSGLQVHGLETAEQHIAALAGPPEPVQLSMLRVILQAAEKRAVMSPEAKRAEFTAAMKNLLEAERDWVTGNMEGTGHQIEQEEQKDAPEIIASVYTIRNEHFADDIARLLSQPTRAFVAIGAGHFAGPSNVLAQLRTRGYTIDRLE